MTAKVGPKCDSEEELKKRFKDLCLDLNLDKTSADEAWITFQRIGVNYALEGDKLHWLACAIYVACRKCVTQTVGRVGKIEGNCVSLTRLLRSSKLSLVQFFSKIKKWSDMASLSVEMRQKVEHLERNFNVSTVIFMKYKPIFEQVFKPPLNPNNKTKSRKQSRKQSVTPRNVFDFCWTLFVHIKSNYTTISDDLVNSYHLLLACIDYCYASALSAENAHELLNPQFSELPSDFHSRPTGSYHAPDKPECIIQSLCKQWDGIYLDAKGIKEHWCKSNIKRMFEKDLLRAKNMHEFGIFDIAYFDFNTKSLTKEYDQYVLNIGDFDERIFLCENAHEELGTPECGNSSVDELTELVQKRQNQTESMNASTPPTCSFFPTTPLSNRHYLSNRSGLASLELTPISNATQTVSRLQSMLLNRKDVPSDELDEIFSQCTSNPREAVIERIKLLGDKFCTAYCQPLNDDSPHSSSQSSLDSQSDEFARRRLTLAVTLYYKALENILLKEKKRIPVEKLSDSLTAIISNETFHISLFACSLEIILFSYSTKRIFPWILDVFGDGNGNDIRLQPFHFYKIIEPFIRDEEGLSREVVKHLNSVEEKILESLAWKSDSPLWDVIKSSGPIPACVDVALPPHSIETSSIMLSPADSRKGAFQSPNSINSGSIISPMKGSVTAKRQLNFGGKESGSSGIQGIPQQGQIVQLAWPTKTSTGEIAYAYMQAIAINPLSSPVPQNANSLDGKQGEQPKAVKPGPLGLFFRKVYNLAGLRLRDLCDRLNINDDDLRRKIWTSLEYALKSHTDLMRDRHLDQIIMCSCYAICKVTKQSNVSFQEIMKCYRMQPQASSHVYRSVLLNSRKRRHSGSSDTSRHSGSSSPSLHEEKERIRSSSTLPVPHPNSQPPTPTRITGTGSQFEFGEERGDVIGFYNNVFLLHRDGQQEYSKFIMKFAPNITSQNGSPPLSPLPRLNANPMSPYRRLSTKHSVFVSPLKTANFPPSPKRPLSYRFLSSPAKDLRAINIMMKGNTGSGRKVSKRILQDDLECENSLSPTKRQCNNMTDPMNRIIRDLVNERQHFSGSNGNSSSNSSSNGSNGNTSNSMNGSD